MAAGPDGGYVITGWFEWVDLGDGTLRAGAPRSGPMHAFIARYDAEGGLRWARRPDATNGAYADVALTADGGAIAIGTREIDGKPGRPVIDRYDAEGGLRWRTSPDGALSYHEAVAVAPDGTVAIGVSLHGSMVVAALDDDGTPRWRHRSRGDDGRGRSTIDVAVTPDGTIVAVGAFGAFGDLGDQAPFVRAFYPDGVVRWELTLGVSGHLEGQVEAPWLAPLAIEAGSAGEVAVVGRAAGAWFELGGNLIDGGEGVGFLAVYEHDGRPRWARSLPWAAEATAVVVLADGDVLVGGAAGRARELEGFVARYGPDGDLRWARQTRWQRHRTTVQALAVQGRVLAALSPGPDLDGQHLGCVVEPELDRGAEVPR